MLNNSIGRTHYNPLANRHLFSGYFINLVSHVSGPRRPSLAIYQSTGTTNHWRVLPLKRVIGDKDGRAFGDGLD